MVGCEGNWFPELLPNAPIGSPEWKPQRPGIYQWANAFNIGKWKGEIRHERDIAASEYQNYDIVWVNACGTSVPTMEKVREATRNSSAVCVFNLDYGVELMQNSFPDIRRFWSVFRQADFIPAQEPAQQRLIHIFLKHISGEKPKADLVPPLLPHPCDVEGLKKLRIPASDRKDELVVVAHRYENQLLIPSMIAYGHGVPTHLIGAYTPFLPTGLFDQISTYVDWNVYMYWMRHTTVCLEWYLIHSQSRVVLENACIGVPTVSTEFCGNGPRVWPLLVHRADDYLGMRETIKRLVNPDDQSFWEECNAYADRAVEFYNWQNSQERFLSAARSWGLNL